MDFISEHPRTLGSVLNLSSVFHLFEGIAVETGSALYYSLMCY